MTTKTSREGKTLKKYYPSARLWSLWGRNIIIPQHSTASHSTETEYSFIQNELRSAAMKLHTREQAPKEGQAQTVTPKEIYTPTHSDYLEFLVDSQHVYQAFEDIIHERPELACLRNTGLERVRPLSDDIAYMVSEYNLQRPNVGQPGKEYAEVLRQITSIPEFICHYYNFYFAHTAGGRMIGKQMSARLLNRKTLEFYKWDGDLNTIKDTVKTSIEEMAAVWSNEEKRECVDATAAAFRGGGAINSYLSGSASSH